MLDGVCWDAGACAATGATCGDEACFRPRPREATIAPSAMSPATKNVKWRDETKSLVILSRQVKIPVASPVPVTSPRFLTVASSAEATPSLLGGTALMIALLLGDWKSPIASPRAQSA